MAHQLGADSFVSVVEAGRLADQRRYPTHWRPSRDLGRRATNPGGTFERLAPEALPSCRAADGTGLPVRDYSREFAAQRTAAGLKAITLGKMRHSNISRMREAGIAADVVAAWHGDRVRTNGAASHLSSKLENLLRQCRSGFSVNGGYRKKLEPCASVK
jgi:hypothetical protein